MTPKELFTAFNSLINEETYISTFDVYLDDCNNEEIDRMYHQLILSLSDLYTGEDRTPEHATRMETIIKKDIQIIQNYLQQ